MAASPPPRHSKRYDHQAAVSPNRTPSEVSAELRLLQRELSAERQERADLETKASRSLTPHTAPPRHQTSPIREVSLAQRKADLAEATLAEISQTSPAQVNC